MLVVSDANSTSRRRPAFSCSHGRTTWKYTPCANVVGRSRRSPATPAVTARRSASIWPATANAGGAGAAVAGSVRTVRRLRHRAAGRGSAPVGAHPVRRARGPRVRAVVSESDPADPRPQSAAGLRGVPVRSPNGRTRSSTTRRVRKPSGTGWICRIHPSRGGGARRRTCWSGRWRIRGSGGRRCRRSEDQPHLVDGLDRVSRGLGGVTRVWRFDRMATVCDPGSGRVTAIVRRGRQALRRVGGDLPAAARQPQGRGGEDQPHCRATLVAHPGRRRHRRAGPGQRGPFRPGAGRHPDAAPPLTGGPRWRVRQAEPLRPLPAAPYPVIVTEARTASRQALVSYRGNRYSVPPELAAAAVTVTHPSAEQFSTSPPPAGS